VSVERCVAVRCGGDILGCQFWGEGRCSFLVIFCLFVSFRFVRVWGERGGG
jgi:hypothetical protein